MATYIQTENGLKKLADKTTKKTIEEALGYIPSYTPNINDYDSDTFYIADSKGNVIFKVDKEGIHSVGLTIKEKTLETIIKENIPSGDYNELENAPNITEDNSGEFQITDTNGNIILRVDSDGISTTSVNTTDGITSEEDNLRIMDSNGNIIFRIDQNGIHSVGLNINNKSLETIIEENTPSGDYNELINKPEITEDNSNVLQIADKYGNVIAKIDAEGVHALNFYVGTGNDKVALEKDIPEPVSLDGVNKEIATIKSTQTTMQTYIEANTEAINTKAHASHTHSYNNLTNKPNIVEDESSVLQITDNYGNIIATISAEGLNTVGFKIDGKEVALKLDLDNLQGTIGSANGIAPLDATGKVSIDYIPDSVLGQLEYKGVWDPRGYSNPATNSAKGHYYIANTTGSYNPDGTSSPSGYDTGDWAVYNGTGWDKVDNTDAVTSVAGLVGPISVVSLVGALKGTTANSLAVGNHTHTEYQPKLKAGTGISIASDGTISVSLASAESGSY